MVALMGELDAVLLPESPDADSAAAISPNKKRWER